MLTILVLLMIAWVCVGAQFVLQRRREGKADSSVVSFRQQLSTLERATPGSTMRQSLTGPVPVVKVDHVPARQPLTGVKRRRRDVLFGLAGAMVFTFLLRLLSPGTVTTLLFVASIAAFGAYVWALRQLHLSALARSASLPAVPAVPGEVDNVSLISSAPSAGSHAARSHVGPVTGTTVFPSSVAAN